MNVEKTRKEITFRNKFKEHDFVAWDMLLKAYISTTLKYLHAIQPHGRLLSKKIQTQTNQHIKKRKSAKHFSENRIIK